MTRKGTHPQAYVAGGPVDVFDPALRQYPDAFVQRAEDPARRAVALAVCLGALGSSPLASAVVVRGSVAMARWFPGRARTPHDLDLVVRDPSVRASSVEAMHLLKDLKDAANVALGRSARVLTEKITTDAIWTYERAEGRRLSIPFVSRDDERDAVQIDVVFEEPLRDAPHRESIEGRPVLFASRAESLAWKLLWLDTDRYPQAKDLYDALLLAESTPLSSGLVAQVYEGKGERWTPNLERFAALSIDWPNLEREYPEFAGGERRWGAELVTALCARLRD